MSKLELLNNIDHQGVTVITKQSRELGAAVAGSVIYPFEVMAAHKEYPVLFQKDSENGGGQIVVLFGFEQNENLFLSESGWAGNYVPAVLRKEPFMIGLQRTADGAVANLSVQIDMDSDRVSREGKGTALFTESGGSTPYLEGIRALLKDLHEGVSLNARMFERFGELDLIEPCKINVNFASGGKFEADMFYTINKERLFALGDDVIGEMHKSGLLQIAYMCIDSLSNINILMAMKDKVHNG